MMGTAGARLDLSSLPPIFISSTHLPTEDLHDAEDNLYQAAGTLTYNAEEARIFLSRVTRGKRAAFDLRANGMWTEEASLPEIEISVKQLKSGPGSTAAPISVSDIRNDAGVIDMKGKRKKSGNYELQPWPDLTEHVAVLKLEWLDACLEKQEIVWYKPYLIYFGIIVTKPPDETPPKSTRDASKNIIPNPSRQPGSSTPAVSDRAINGNSILSRAKADTQFDSSDKSTSSPFGHRRRFNQSSASQKLTHDPRPPKLHRTTTSEFEEAQSHTLPDPPSWLLEPHPRPLYSCLRSTPAENPNPHFIAQLTKIKEARLLTLDEIGVRAYSTSIAALAAYPHRITSPLEVLRLPGCDQKIATLWVEWHDSMALDVAQYQEDDAALDARRSIPIVQDLEADPDIKVLRILFDIHGVGADTARKFYLQNGWKDVDDVVEFGWKSLNRVQQIGVKFYDEFKVKIPQAEVEQIAFTVLKHARLCKGISEGFWSDKGIVRENWKDEPATTKDNLDPRDFVSVIVGGYRRGKIESGDVDVILSHRDDRLTHDLIIDVVASLESEGFITHTLTLNTTTSDRGGNTLPFRADGAGGRHHFDSLDKALCVWQDPKFEDEGGKVVKNPNVHRRVDIIISPWRSVGAAVLGWSGGTTFQRDIRRWVKREKGWKFDSSGIRDRRDGLVMELEAPTDVDTRDRWQDRERRLMEGLGIEWRPARERCTG